jgi:DNA-binding MarR family transcriptional regulator
VTPAEPAPSIDVVIDALDRLMHRLMVSHAAELSTTELTMAQLKTLYVVLAAERIRMSELAGRLHVTSSTATGLVDRLVELDLVERHEDPSDRRQVVVTATPAAGIAVEQFRELNSARVRELLAKVGPADLAIVHRAIDVLAASLPINPNEVHP